MYIYQDFLIIEYANGTYKAIPIVVVLLAALIFIGLLAVCAVVIEADSKARQARYVAHLPAEIKSPQSTDFYREQTERTRALKAKLDADTDLAESYIKAIRTQGELEEIPEILSHEQTKRMARNR